MKYIDFRNVYGRFANHLYLCLQIYILRKKYGEDVKYLTNDYFSTTGQYDNLKKFDLQDMVEIKPEPNVQIINMDQISECRIYRQHLGINFQIEDIEEFIRKYILHKIEKKSNDDTIGIHIRLGDYEKLSRFSCFDKIDYLSKCLHSFNNTKNIKIFSDDINKCRELMNNFDTITNISYSNNKSDIDDFVELCGFKNKILWNSTFSYWTAFISNVIYEDSFSNIFVPDKFTSNESSMSRINPKWNIVQVI